ncbi:MAG TPA: TldD/PmbA family protein [Candidatus Acidoferrales bacterium]|nr:TldD/PmbA family protein [Candidatus Acidoferrales bacterium]
MFERQAYEELAKRVLAYSPADETEVVLCGDAAGLTRFTHNAVHQNVASRNLTVRVRAVTDHRVGVAVTNELDAAALERTARRAFELSRFAPRDEALPALHYAPPVPAPPGAFFTATARATPERRAQLASHIFSVAETEALWAAGYVATAYSAVAVANSAGTLSWFEGSEASLNVKQNAPDSTGYAQSFHRDVDAIDPTMAASVAGAKAQASRNPVQVDPGAWTVILEPAAFGEFIGYLPAHFSAQALDEGWSFLHAGLERSYFGENVTIVDDYAHPLGIGMPFDFEGTPKRRIPLVEAGVARNVVTDSYWAHKLSLPNTGHALPAPSETGPQPTNIVVMPGSKTTAQLVAETKRGLLVSRFWYIRTVDRRKAIITGMTRDGTFLIEDGKLTRGVRNMRFNQSIFEALRNAEFSCEPVRTNGFDGEMVVPTAKITGFRFSSGTEF